MKTPEPHADKRATKRVPIDSCQLKIISCDSHVHHYDSNAKAYDISLEGLSGVCDTLFGVSDKVQAILYLDNKQLVIPATVVRAKKLPESSDDSFDYSYALRFVEHLCSSMQSIIFHYVYTPPEYEAAT